MKKHFILILFGVFSMFQVKAQDIYMSKEGVISFLSEAPLENIFAESKELSSAINIKTNKISCKVKITTLKMENSLQQEHLNEKYLESHQFPHATFTGDILNGVEWTRDGEYPVQVKGILKIHGVDQERTIDGVITIVNGVISVESTFNVKVENHDVTIPKLVFQKVAEEVEVKLKAIYQLAPSK